MKISELVWQKKLPTRTNDAAGDGTTTTVVLVDGIVREGLRYVTSGVNPFALSRGLHKAVDHLVEQIMKKSVKIETKEQIKQVAALSAQDEMVGELIADVMEEVGTDGVIRSKKGKPLVWRKR